jgi:hypothetical protein
MKAAEARSLAVQAAAKRVRAEELRAAASSLRAENVQSRVRAEARFNRVLNRVRDAALAAAERAQPLVCVTTVDSNELASALEAVSNLVASGYTDPLLLPCAFDRIHADAILGSVRADKARNALTALQLQAKNARKLEYLDRVRRRREFIREAVEQVNLASRETFDEMYVHDVQRQLESGTEVPDAIFEECAKKLVLRIPEELRVSLSEEVLQTVPTAELDSLLSLLPKRLDESALTIAWQLKSVEEHWNGALVSSPGDSPHYLLDQRAYLAPDRGSDPLSNPHLLPWVATRSRVAFERVYEEVANAAEREANELRIFVRGRVDMANATPRSTSALELSLIRLQSLGLPIDDRDQAMLFVKRFLSALGYKVESKGAEGGEFMRLAWT